jgi:hypothetical protein
VSSCSPRRIKKEHKSNAVEKLTVACHLLLLLFMMMMLLLLLLLNVPGESMEPRAVQPSSHDEPVL